MSSGRALTFLGTASRSCPESAEIWRTSAWGQTGLPTPPSCGLPVERENGASKKTRTDAAKQGVRIQKRAPNDCVTSGPPSAHSGRKEGAMYGGWRLSMQHHHHAYASRRHRQVKQSAPTRPSYSLDRTPHRSTRTYGTSKTTSQFMSALREAPSWPPNAQECSRSTPGLVQFTRSAGPLC